ncbi:ImpA family type VI secretion system protein [Thetidibacter halocola]|uniref:Type VI secretion system ImpA family N-terminal domain-containing protein n=1 Tax=Thetidibacter halocola TaxID=2827239 RepID=A0A8J7W9Q9_9RHOB|nr:type VI secretion system ImpA family N-terminal domain-containing protein [Thetidibacter halocola]MBS0123565.1 type VI secretion system ImpA family N-terminal domain-containing protein [Thetidibacter halocola]
MKIEPLLEPVSAEAPCGEDLKKSRDAGFMDIYLASNGRLPKQYVMRGGVGNEVGDTLLDRSEINFRTEAKSLDDLLLRSRDLRYLVLRAQWAALTANLPELADTIAACAALLETFGPAVQPEKPDERKRALNGLSNLHTMVLPLQFHGLTGTTDVTLRKIRVAREESTPFSFEEDIKLQPLLDALRSEANAKAVTQTHEQLVRLRDGLTRLAAACKSEGGGNFTPDLSGVADTVRQMLAAISEVRSDLHAAAPEPQADAGPRDESRADAPGDAPAAAPARVADLPGPKVVSQAHARRLLEACEAYYRRNEPSSAALLLVTQARLLIGRPLIEAIETLMPEKAGSARISLGPGGFLLGMDRLRGLTSAADEAQDAAPEPDPGPEISVTSSTEAAAALRSVEEWFRAVERSSPVPMLLARARGYLNRDFQSILDELLPDPEG